MKPTHGSNRKFYFIASDILIDENALWPSIEYSMTYASDEYKAVIPAKAGIQSNQLIL